MIALQPTKAKQYTLNQSLKFNHLIGTDVGECGADKNLHTTNECFENELSACSLTAPLKCSSAQRAVAWLIK